MSSSAYTETHTAALSRLGYALSDKTRTQILLALKRAPAIPSELSDSLGVSRQIISNQLSCLRGCGLVKSIRQGRNYTYQLAEPALSPALDSLMKLVLAVDPECCSEGGCCCR